MNESLDINYINVQSNSLTVHIQIILYIFLNVTVNLYCLVDNFMFYFFLRNYYRVQFSINFLYKYLYIYTCQYRLLKLFQGFLLNTCIIILFSPNSLRNIDLENVLYSLYTLKLHWNCRRKF